MEKKRYFFLTTFLLLVLFIIAQKPSSLKIEPYQGEKGIKRTISSLTNSAANSRQSSIQPSKPIREVPLKARLDEFRNFKKSLKTQVLVKEPPEFDEISSEEPTSSLREQALPATTSNLDVWSNFLGTSFNEFPYAFPPDPTGAVGGTQVVITSNALIKVFEKRGVTDAPLLTPTGTSNKVAPSEFSILLDDFFSPLLRRGSYTSDPHVRYDRLSKRWFIVAIEVDTSFQNNYILLAVSDGDRITNTSSFTYFRIPSAIFTYNHTALPPFLDYPTLGVDKNAILIGGNAYFGLSVNFIDSINSVAYAIDKRALLRGTLFLYVTKVGSETRTSSSGMSTPQGVYNDDPSATKSFFAGTAASMDGLFLTGLTFNTTGTFFGLTGISQTRVPVERFQFPRDVTAPGSPMRIDPLDTRLFAAAIYKNKLTGKSSLWTAHAIGVNRSGTYVSDTVYVQEARTASRWYEIDSIYTRPHLNQAGTLSNPRPSGRRAVMYFNPSIATNGQGRSVLSGTTAAFNQFLNVFIAGRNAEDAPGTLDSVQKATTTRAIYAPIYGYYYFDRWGDFSQTVVDPLDDQTIWTFQEYANADDSYGIRAVQIKAPPPATPLPLGTLSNKADTVVTLTGISVDQSGFFDPGTDVGGPGYNRLSVKSTGNIIVSNIKFISPTEISFKLAIKNKAAGRYTLVITNPDGQLVTTTYTIRANASTSTVSNTVTATNAQKYITSSSAYPNPTKDEFKLLLNAAKSMTGRIVILDMTGKQLFEKNYSLIKGRNEAVISLADYPSGTYIAAVYSATNIVIETKTIVKN